MGKAHPLTPSRSTRWSARKTDRRLVLTEENRHSPPPISEPTAWYSARLSATSPMCNVSPLRRSTPALHAGQA